MARKRKLRPESVSGLYSPFPFEVLDSEAFMHATHPARSMLFELMRQHNGENNGRLQLTASWLSRRGWRASDVIRRARDNLLERRLIVLTRKGGRTIGADWFALAWLDITNFQGLDIQRGEYRKGLYRLIDLAGPARGANRRAPKQISCAGAQRTPARADSTANPDSALSNSAKTILFGQTPALAYSEDVIIAIGDLEPSHPRTTSRRLRRFVANVL